jgi:hypothetical protein
MEKSKATEWLNILTNIGVIAGIVLLAYELNQNAALMRAEMHAMRAEAKSERQMFLANDGEVARIAAKIIAEGFPANREAASALTIEERFRYAIFLEGFKEAVANWHFQCQQALLDAELCDAGYRAEAISLLRFTHGMGVGLSNLRQSFIADLRRIANEEGMPAPNEDGKWPE